MIHIKTTRTASILLLDASKHAHRKIEFLADCKTVIMNGPMGVFEMEPFSEGTFGIVDNLVDLTKEKGAVTIIGGGDSVAATEQSGRAGDRSHISTGGTPQKARFYLALQLL